jgi:hypothetical protein
VKGIYSLIPWKNFGNEANYVISHLGLYQNGVQGIVDPTEFANKLVTVGWSADPRTAYVNGFVARFAQVQSYEEPCSQAIMAGLTNGGLP